MTKQLMAKKTWRSKILTKIGGKKSDWKNSKKVKKRHKEHETFRLSRRMTLGPKTQNHVYIYKVYMLAWLERLTFLFKKNVVCCTIKKIMTCPFQHIGAHILLWTARSQRSSRYVSDFLKSFYVTMRFVSMQHEKDTKSAKVIYINTDAHIMDMTLHVICLCWNLKEV